jgi:hypothetical protein
MINWIDLDPHTIRIIDFIGFNNFVIVFLFNYTIKIDAYKIEYRPQNIYLFKISNNHVESKQK